MKKFFVIYLGLVVIFSGCIIKPEQKSPKFGNLQYSVSAQDAIIKIAVGWTGGMGSMPVVDDQGEAVNWNGVPIYFDESKSEDVKAKLPECFVGQPEIKIAANITLVPKSDVNDSLLEPVEQNYYSAKVNQIYNIEVKAEKCAD